MWRQRVRTSSAPARSAIDDAVETDAFSSTASSARSAADGAHAASAAGSARQDRRAAATSHTAPCRGQRDRGVRRRSGSRGAIAFDLLIEHQRPASMTASSAVRACSVPRGLRAGHDHAQPFRATRGMKQRQPLGQVPDAEATWLREAASPVVARSTARSNSRRPQACVRDEFESRPPNYVSPTSILVGRQRFNRATPAASAGASLAVREPAQQRPVRRAGPHAAGRVNSTLSRFFVARRAASWTRPADSSNCASAASVERGVGMSKVPAPVGGGQARRPIRFWPPPHHPARAQHVGKRGKAQGDIRMYAYYRYASRIAHRAALQLFGLFQVADGRFEQSGLWGRRGDIRINGPNRHFTAAWARRYAWRAPW